MSLVPFEGWICSRKRLKALDQLLKIRTYFSLYTIYILVPSGLHRVIHAKISSKHCLCTYLIMFLEFFIACIFKFHSDRPRCGSSFPLLGFLSWRLVLRNSIHYLFGHFLFPMFSVICFGESYYLGRSTDIFGLVCLYIWSCFFHCFPLLVRFLKFYLSTIEKFILLILFCNFPRVLSTYFVIFFTVIYDLWISYSLSYFLDYWL